MGNFANGACGGSGGSGDGIVVPSLRPELTVSVTPASPSPRLVPASITLSWTSKYCKRVTDWLGREVSASGSSDTTLTTPGTHEFAMSCVGDGGTVSAKATVVAMVAPVAPAPDLIIWGDSMEPPLFSTETFSDTACAVVEEMVKSGTRRLMRFGIEARNVGTLDLHFGDPAGNPLFTFAPCHGHYHFDDFALYRLVDSTGQTVGTGLKVGFCLGDFSRWDPSANPRPRYNFAECTPQGIQAGWSDIYGSFLDGQWIDITGVPGGMYTLVLTVDPENRIAETDETNNVLRVQVTIPPAPGASLRCKTECR